MDMAKLKYAFHIYKVNHLFSNFNVHETHMHIAMLLQYIDKNIKTFENLCLATDLATCVCVTHFLLLIAQASVVSLRTNV